MLLTLTAKSTFILNKAFHLTKMNYKKQKSNKLSLENKAV